MEARVELLLQRRSAAVTLRKRFAYRRERRTTHTVLGYRPHRVDGQAVALQQ